MVQWQPPNKPKVKLNSNVDWNDNGGVGIGGILRNHNGQFIAVWARPTREALSAEMVEIVVGRQGLLSVKGWCYEDVQVKGDTQSLFNSLKNQRSYRSYMGTLLADIVSMSRDFKS
ncbi:hypothetical protein L6164_008624 [Bauhinia variegata]|uniref:Uncharacterized protein n=1 Tax=Bauhinia variegata TaxID=167791 RepID=A0ACB9PGB3_BAUVA|nr:hypothetical protein L6164_008624 [Bauhinia variegata]